VPGELTYRGACACGNVAIEFRTAVPREALQIRSCRCPFCVEREAAYTSDHDGAVVIRIADKAKVNRWRFSALEKSAGYLICESCGTYMGAVAEFEKGTYATLNVRRFPELVDRIPAAAPVDYSNESAEEAKRRQLAKWTPASVEA
jgi:hypothetical protein